MTTKTDLAPTVTLLDILTEGRAKIADPRNWHQNSLYADEDRVHVASFEEAVCYCAAGAVLATAYTRLGTMRPGSLMGTQAWGALDAATRVVTHGRLGEVSNLNDEPDTEHGQILAVFDQAIATARREASAS